MDYKYFSEASRLQMLPQYAWNATVNHARIWADFDREDMAFRTIAKMPNIPAIVVGSGPSLDLAIPTLKGWDGVIIASASQLNVLEYHGIKPTFILAMDTADSVADQLKDTLYRNVMLITHQAVSPKVLETWKGPRRYFLNKVGGEWDTLQASVYPWIEDTFPPMGCVVTAGVQIAFHLGCSPIILAGVDFSFPEGKQRFTEYKRRGTYLWNEIPSPIVTLDPPTEVTTHEMRYYYSMLLILWRTHGFRLLALPGSSDIVVKHVVRISEDGKVGPDVGLPPKDLIDEYLAMEGIALHDDGAGETTIEYFDPALKKAETTMKEIEVKRSRKRS